MVARLRDDRVDRIRVRSALTCEATHGVCAACYGKSLATGKMIELGEAVGVMPPSPSVSRGPSSPCGPSTPVVWSRGHHHGLPRVVELFEARTPRVRRCSHATRVVRIEDEEGGRRITWWPTTVPRNRHWSPPAPTSKSPTARKSGGDALVEGRRTRRSSWRSRASGDPAVPRRRGPEGLRDRACPSRQAHRAHRPQMLPGCWSQSLVTPRSSRESASTTRSTPRSTVRSSRRASAPRGPPGADGHHQGSWPRLVAVGGLLPETTRVLTEAAIEGRSDQLFGLKENIIIASSSGRHRHGALPRHPLEMPARRHAFWACAATAGRGPWPPGWPTSRVRGSATTPSTVRRRQLLGGRAERDGEDAATASTLEAGA